MNIASDIGWKSFITQNAGTASFSISGDKLNCSNGTAGSGNYAYKKKIYFAKAGETYTFSVIARRISGTNGTSGAISIYFPDQTANANKVEITSSDWQLYELRYTVPLSASSTTYIQFNAGLIANQAGEVEISEPRITVENSPFGGIRSIGHSLFQWNGSTTKDLVALPNWSSFNIGTMSYVQADKALYIQVETVNISGLNARPLFFCQMAPEGDAIAIRSVPKVGSYNSTTGIVKVQFMDTSTGLYVDINDFNVIFSLIGII